MKIEVTWQRSGASESGGASSALCWRSDGLAVCCFVRSFSLCTGLSTANDAYYRMRETPTVQGHFFHLVWCDGSNHPLLQCWHRAGTQWGCVAVLLTQGGVQPPERFFVFNLQSKLKDSIMNKWRKNIYYASFYAPHWGKVTQWASCKRAHTGFVTSGVTGMFLSAQI